MLSSYDYALPRVLKHEGGYTNHPSDPGGPTNWGITLARYSEFLGRKATAADVKAMPLAHAKAIYKPKYWDVLALDLPDFPAGVDYALFDYSVNSGPARAAKVLQRIVSANADGKVGVKTLKALAGYLDIYDNHSQTGAAALINAVCAERLAFVKSLRTWPVFGAGWGRRIAEVKRDALKLASGAKS